MKSHRFYLKMLVALSCLVYLSSNHADAQQRQRLQVQSAPATSDVVLKGKKILQNAVPVFKVTPGEPQIAQHNQSDLAFVRRLSFAADPLSQDQKIKALGGGQPPAGATDVQTKPDPKLSELTLSARAPYRNKLGYLEFNEVRHFDAEQDYVMWYMPNAYMGFMKLHLNVEKGERYLIDYNVSCMEEREFHYYSTGGTQSTKLQKGSHHLLAIIEPEASGWTSMLMWADEDWAFYNVNISKMD